MKVLALETGFFAGARVRKGTTFDVPEGTRAKWFAPVESEAAKAPGKAPAKADKLDKPATLSEHGKDKSKSFVETMKPGELA